MKEQKSSAMKRKQQHKPLEIVGKANGISLSVCFQFKPLEHFLKPLCVIYLYEPIHTENAKALMQLG